jgi:Lar family restriction alleviation protein
MMSDLKPCPFCGGKAILLQSGFVFQVQCGSCGASGRNDDKTTSVAHWNTRTEEQLDAVRGLADKWRNCGAFDYAGYQHCANELEATLNGEGDE